MIHEMQQILMEDVAYIIPYYSQAIEAWRTDTFTGWLDDDPTFGLDGPDVARRSCVRPNRPTRVGDRPGARCRPISA